MVRTSKKIHRERGIVLLRGNMCSSTAAVVQRLEDSSRKEQDGRVAARQGSCSACRAKQVWWEKQVDCMEGHWNRGTVDFCCMASQVRQWWCRACRTAAGNGRVCVHAVTAAVVQRLQETKTLREKGMGGEGAGEQQRKHAPVLTAGWVERAAALFCKGRESSNMP
jgi:hypothetical protein